MQPPRRVNSKSPDSPTVDISHRVSKRVCEYSCIDIHIPDSLCTLQSHRAREATPRSPSHIPHPPTPVFQNARSVSPSRDNSDFDMGMDGDDPFTPPHEPIQRNDPGTLIVITEDEDEPVSQATPEPDEESVGSAPDIEVSKAEKKQRAKLRIIKRIYPAFMRERMMNDAARPKGLTKPRPRQASGSDEEQQLLPGHTRVRIAEHPRDLRDVKGDSESEDEQRGPTGYSSHEDDGPAASDSDLQVVSHRQKRRAPDVSLWPSSDEDVLSDGMIDDERIAAYLKEGDAIRSGLREKDMIDWMLDNTAEVGGTRRPSTRAKSSHPKRSSRPKISITVGGVRNQRRAHQTLLKFGEPSNRERSPEGRHARSSLADTNTPDTAAAAPAARKARNSAAVRQAVLQFDEPYAQRSRNRRRESVSYSGAEGAYPDDAPPFLVDELPPSPLAVTLPLVVNVNQIPHPDALRKGAKKQKEKEKRARAKMNGVHIFLPLKGSRIIGQRSKTVSINVADRSFHRALAPIKSHKRQHAPNVPKPYIKPNRPASAEVSTSRRLLPRGTRPAPAGVETDETREDSHDDEPLDAEEQAVLVDFGISVRSKITFGPDTYTGRGSLGELVNPAAGTKHAVFCSAHGFDLGPNVTTPQFLAVIGRIFDALIEFAVALPQADTEEQAQDWTRLLHATCRLVTALLDTDEESQTLKDRLETEIFRLTSKMREAALTADSIDWTTFTICWFGVELAIRSGFRLPSSSASRLRGTNVLQEACSILIDHLLEYGLERGMAPLINFKAGTDGSTTAHRALEMWVGVWHVMDKYRNPTSTSVNPLWRMVQTALTGRLSPTTSAFEASETAWRAIITLSSISQYKPPGVPDTPCCPACWDVVLFALERIRFEASAEVDETVSDSGLDAHDQYIRIVAERCCLLWSRWHWPLNDAFDVLNRLAVIFRSRQFANLRHEKAEFPDFLRVNDWTLLSRRIHTESTFELALKLVYQTLLVNTSKVKKLLSLATPVGSLPWSKAHPPSIGDLSMLFNRFSIIAIAIHIEPRQHARWIQLARGYVKFGDVDATTRNAHIRGLMYLSVVMVQRSIPLDEALAWLDEMVTVLLGEPRGPTVVLGIHALVVSVRNVIRAFKSESPKESPHRYPDPRLICKGNNANR
jgi:hypothetical protein